LHVLGITLSSSGQDSPRALGEVASLEAERTSPAAFLSSGFLLRCQWSALSVIDFFPSRSPGNFCHCIFFSSPSIRADLPEEELSANLPHASIFEKDPRSAFPPQVGDRDPPIKSLNPETKVTSLSPSGDSDLPG